MNANQKRELIIEAWEDIQMHSRVRHPEDIPMMADLPDGSWVCVICLERGELTGHIQ